MKAIRLKQIQEYVQKEGVCSYEDLCRHCGASISTIRRDIEQLASQKLVIKSHGGILRAETEEAAEEKKPELKDEPAYFNENYDKIARCAAELVEDNDIIFLGSGATVAHMVKYLVNKKGIMIITNNLLVVQEIADYDGIHVTMIGGDLSRSTNSVLGIQSIRQLNEMNANKAFISCNGIAPSHGVTNYNSLEVDIKRKAMSISAESVLLVDHNKFNKISLYTIADLPEFSTIITDRNVESAYMDIVRSNDIRLIIA